MAAFIVLLLIIAHRLLRFDLLLFPNTKPQFWLFGLFAVSIAWEVSRGLFFGIKSGKRFGFPISSWSIILDKIRTNFSFIIAIQWFLFFWSLISRLVSDGLDALEPFMIGDYSKDIVFISAVALVLTHLDRFRIVFGLLVVVLVFVSLTVIPQRYGEKRCHYFRVASLLNYEQTTDRRPCRNTAECYEIPRHEQHLREHGWACERTGPLNLATVVGRVHYAGNLNDPNTLALTLVLGVSLMFGLAAWPGRRKYRWLWLIGLPVFTFAIILAASRAAQLALGIVLFFSFCFCFGKRTAFLAIFLSAPLAIYTTRNEAEAAYSTITRIMTYLNGFYAFRDYPVFGVGFANYERISFLNAHNSFLQALVETGVLGGSLYVSGIYSAIKFLIGIIYVPSKELSTSPRYLEIRHVARTLLIMFLGVLPCAFFLSLAFDFLWLLPIALVAGLELFVRREFPADRLTLRVGEFLLVCLATLLLVGVFVFVTAR